jgi:hypothetical protein
MTATEIENLAKEHFDAGLRVAAVANEDGSVTVKVSTAFTVPAAATPAQVHEAIHGHLINAQAVFHTLSSAYQQS